MDGRALVRCCLLIDISLIGQEEIHSQQVAMALLHTDQQRGILV
jgi:hypothetical protein